MTKEITQIQKRDGRKVPFDPAKITNAMFKAFMATNEVGGEKKSLKEAQRLTPIAVDLFSQTIDGKTPSVETMQDVIEKVLMAAGHYETAKAYILYREKQEKTREAKAIIGVSDDLDLTLNQLKVIESRYLRHNENGEVIETPKQLFERVAKAVAANEKNDKDKWQKLFLEMMTKMEFVPAGGYLRTAGTAKTMIANCFVLPVEDSMSGIFDSVKWMALVHQKGGGTGFNFSKLRPKGDYVVSSGGYSSGPVSFMKVFDAATQQVMQGGFRMGANMGILSIDHPDILDFITCKSEENNITNFNISVGITDKFMQALSKNADFDLLNPRDKTVVQTLPARTLFDQIVTLAWRTGDPGVIFLDAMNRHNPLIKTYGPMIATNPCGEQPLHPFDACNLGSINLARFITADKKINWQRLEDVVRLAVRFLDNGIDISSYPIEQIAEMVAKNRRIGLGVMGWADMLYQLEIAYNSDEAFSLAEKIMRFIYVVSHNQSEKLAKEKGKFPNWKGSSYEEKGVPQRNLAITTIAPTGTISMVADCSSGIEPVFALSYVKNVVEDNGLSYVNPYFTKALEHHVLDENLRTEILEKVAQTGSCQNVEGVPEKLREVFTTAHDISWQDHIKMQASFQKWTDNAVSKTINFPNSASIEEISQAYQLAWQLGCKGMTIYRDGSKDFQILQHKKGGKKISKIVIQSQVKTKSLKERMEEKQELSVKNKEISEKNSKSEFLNSKQIKSLKQKNKNSKLITNHLPLATESCPECGSPLQKSEGCSMCLACGFSKCSL